MIPHERAHAALGVASGVIYGFFMGNSNAPHLERRPPSRSRLWTRCGSAATGVAIVASEVVQVFALG